MKNRKNRKDNLPVGVIIWGVIIFGLFVWVINHHSHSAKKISRSNCPEEICIGWLRAEEIPSASRNKVIKLVKSDLQLRNKAGLARLKTYQPRIMALCRECKVSPWAIDGLVLQESSADKYAVDYAFTDGLSNQTFIGLGQLSYDELHGPRRFRHSIIRLANRWRQARWRKDYAKADILLAKWAAIDPRFDPDRNLSVLAKEVRYNTNNCGDITLAWMAHHGGTNDPLRRVAYYRRDHSGVPYSNHPTGIAQYVKKYHLNYFKLVLDKSPGRRYWIHKKDGHMDYGYYVAAKAEAFYRYAHHLPVNNKPHPKRVRSFL